MLLSPPGYPRSMGELDQQTDVVTLWGGANLRIARIGSLRVVLGAAVGVQRGKVRLDAYGTMQDRVSTSPASMAEVALVGPAGPLAWRATVAWREARLDLGSTSSYAEDTTSGVAISAGIEW